MRFLRKTRIYINNIPKVLTCTALFHTALLSIFKILPTSTFIPTCTIIQKTRVLVACTMVAIKNVWLMDQSSTSKFFPEAMISGSLYTLLPNLQVYFSKKVWNLNLIDSEKMTIKAKKKSHFQSTYNDKILKNLH